MKTPFLFLFILIQFLFARHAFTQTTGQLLRLNDSSYFEKRGLNIFVFNNYYGLFNDEKLSGIEIIHHGIRTATNGDVRLSPTPEQWDPIPELIERKTNREENSITNFLRYSKFDFDYEIKVAGKNGGLVVTVNLEKPLPKELEGYAGLNLEFLPSAYFEKTYMLDQNHNMFPLYPSSAMEITPTGKIEPKPLVIGKRLTLAPEDPFTRISIETSEGELSLFDGRNLAQNGWFVVRTLIPKGKTGKVIEWFLDANTIPDWIRTPMIAHSQLGYHPNQDKVAVIEFDMNDTPVTTARLFKVNENGKLEEKFTGELKYWGKYLRYNYSTFDFTSIKDHGIFIIEYDTIITMPFSIGKDIYENAWHPTLDIFLPVQMDHMLVNEAYRVWHGASHLDDALQAPINHKHFDLYAQGLSTDTPYNPGEHIPGLNVGGWYDAGDYDIRTQTQYFVMLNLVHVWENFILLRDQTTINQMNRYVDIHHPDGKPDILQQIEHGTLQLLAQFKSSGHAINGIVEAHLSQYTHLGDASVKTDNLIYNSKLDSLESDGFYSGTFDDRWAFTTKSSALNYGCIAALAAASRALQGYNDKLSEECLNLSVKVWDEEHSHEPDLFSYGNTTGGQLKAEELKAAVELLSCTKNNKYKLRIVELLNEMESNDRQVIFNAANFVQALPYMDETYSNKVKSLVIKYKAALDRFGEENPFGVFISRGGWAGNGAIINFALTSYFLHNAFPELIESEYVYKGLNYIFGCHPGSNISFVSGVGTKSKRIAYGNNRADYSFIAGGIVPGVLIVKPDFPENKENWPFIWGENEYVVSLAASYIYLVNAVNALLQQSDE
jgi:endoglucanase